MHTKQAIAAPGEIYDKVSLMTKCHYLTEVTVRSVYHVPKTELEKLCSVSALMQEKRNKSKKV